jgi:hypothetical protein
MPAARLPSAVPSVVDRLVYQSRTALEREEAAVLPLLVGPVPKGSPMSDLVAQVIVLAPNFNSEGVVEWGVKNIIPLILLVVGIGIIASARKGQMSQNAMTVTNIMLGCVVIAGAALFYGFADSIASFVFSS